MNLNDAQKQTVSRWISEGLKLAEIQKRIASEFGFNPTYMEVRLLVDDLKLTPRDPEPPRPVNLPGPVASDPRSRSSASAESLIAPPGTSGAASKPAAPGSAVSISVDQISRAGALVSGKVTFSDGKSAEWYLDQMGRLGLAPAEKGYKPSTPDLQAFQMELQGELARLGY